VLDNWLPRLSPRARALLAAERGRSEDGHLKARAIERAQAAIDGERSGVSLRQAGERRFFGTRSRVVRGTVLAAAAAVAVAGLAAAGMRFVIGSSSDGSEHAPRVELAQVAPTPAQSLDSQPRPAPEADGTAARASAPSPSSPLPSSPPAASRTPARGRANDVKQQYAIELRLLEPARSSIARGDYGGALTAIARHRREYPNGQLAEERDALGVRALSGLGQRSAAEASAADFRRRYPRSALLSWMRDQPKQ
jgi:hypothetical protein